MRRRVVSSDFARRRTSRQFVLLLADLLVIDKSGSMMARSWWASPKFGNLLPELRTDGTSEQQPVFFDHAADLVSISLRMPTRRDRATSIERILWLSSLLTFTSRYQPTRTGSASPRASF